ncbi:MAG: BrnT family toxin [Novosphingobium sp.]|nr:BrnT family toxin [Novosphingobium sp.]
MAVEFDRAKDAINIAKHGLSLADADMLDLLSAHVEVDARTEYGEPRYRAFGRIEGEGYCLAYTVRGTTLRPISFRRAHDREMRRYGR